MSSRLLVLILLGACLWAVGSRPGWAQESPIRVTAQNDSLGAVLSSLRADGRLDLVYADRLVQGKTTSCSYDGRDPAAALQCVLDGTGLEAERVRRRQYVLVRASDPAGPGSADRVSLGGHIVDAETGERLPGANVYLTELKAGTTTNRDGYFVFSSLPPGPYDAQISYVGYRTIDTTLVAGQNEGTISIAPTPIQADGVVVRAGSTNADNGVQRPGMMSVPLGKLEHLPSFSEPDLFRALQWTPGIRKPGVFGGGLSVRGADPDQNLYLLDGAPVYHPWHAFNLISTFQTGTLRSTNLYRGGFPVEYGGRLSAVLDAQMKDGSREEPAAEAAFGALSGRFRIEAPVTSRTSFMLSGRRSYIDKLIGRTHPVTDEAGRRDTLRTGYFFYDTSAKIAHRANDTHRFTLSYYFGRDNLDLRLPFDLSLDFDSWLRPADLFFEVEQDWENRVVSAQHQYLPAENVFVTTTAYYSGYRADEGSFVQPTATSSLVSDYRVRLHDIGAKVHATYHPSVRHELSGGLEVSTLQFESTLRSRLQRSVGVTQQRNEVSRVGAVKVAGYLQDRWTPTPRWTVEPGVRASVFSNGGFVRVAPRLGGRYVVHPQRLVLNASAGVHAQYLHRLRDRYSLTYDLVSSRWVPASTQVRPAMGAQVGLGAQSQLGEGLTLELDTYLQGARRILVPADVFQEKDGIEGPGIEVGALVGQYTVGEKRSFGAELSAVYDRGPWNARMGVTSGRTFLRAPGQIQTGDRWRPADLDVPLTLRGAVSWQGGPWRATVASEWRSGYPITTPEARYRVGDPVDSRPSTYLYRPEVNNDRLDPHFRIDVIFGYAFQFLSADWAARLNLYNATNRANEADRTYRPTASGVSAESQRGLPILPLLELEMSL
ncbi:MAG: TonB-dependent receptor domain-containing protein [Salinivenus sp.]